MHTAILTALTLVAFAANSLLCRMALGAELIDPVSFTTLRLLSGAAILVPIARYTARARSASADTGSWGSGVALFVYAIAFSLAYVSLETGLGALILFGAVQVTMLTAGLKSGERPHAFEWLGLVVALGGLVYLVLPGITAPNPLGAILMAASGIAWGVYSIRGKDSNAPIAATSGNFVRTIPLAIVASAIAYSWIRYESPGVTLAVLSGAITSGLGYVLWYRALRNLTASRAALVQLLVPVLAAFGGVVFLAEDVSLRLVIASALILGGIAVAVVRRRSLPARRNG
jgi:drug/metabolite transporter (DMT)-like permease